MVLVWKRKLQYRRSKNSDFPPCVKILIYHGAAELNAFMLDIIAVEKDRCNITDGSIYKWNSATVNV